MIEIMYIRNFSLFIKKQKKFAYGNFVLKFSSAAARKRTVVRILSTLLETYLDK